MSMHVDDAIFDRQRHQAAVLGLTFSTTTRDRLKKSSAVCFVQKHGGGSGPPEAGARQHAHRAPISRWA